LKDLTNGTEGKLISQFAIPIILGHLFMQLYNIVDGIIVGKFVGDEALAAVGASFPIIFLLISLVVGISNGGTIIVSQYFGAKDIDNVRKTIDTINVFLFFASIVVSVSGIFFCESIFKLINLPEEVIPEAVLYLKIYFAGIIGLFGYHGVSAILRGLGDSKTPLYCLIISSILNVILDLLFIVVFKWGVGGAAWATVISQGLTFVGLAIYLNKTNKIVKIKVLGIGFDSSIFKKSIHIGLPSGLQQSFVGLGNIALMGIVSKFGTVAVAAYTVAGRIDMLAAVPAIAYSAAVATFTGQNIGAQKLDRVNKGFNATLIISSLISLLLGGLIILFRNYIMLAFTTDEEIIKLGTEYLTIVSMFYIVFSVLFVSNGVLRGAGDTIVPMFITLFALWLIRIPMSYILSTYFGVSGIWWGIPAGWFFGMILAFYYFKTGKWKKKAIIKIKNDIDF
jgi:putative MATE family efflux protein